MRATKSTKAGGPSASACPTVVPHVPEPPLPATSVNSLPSHCHPAPGHEEGLILALPYVAAPLKEVNVITGDPLQAYPDAFLDGRDADTNVDMFLNLNNVEDVEMSAESSKRKRDEEGEEVTSQALGP